MAVVVLVRQSRPHFEVNYTHPLGLLSLASYVRARGDHEVHILDNRIEQWPLHELVRRTVDKKPDIVGLTAMSVEAPIMYEYSREVRKAAPNAFQVAGGIHATAFGEALLEEAPIDAAVLGEGEITFGKVIDARLGRGELSEIAGVVYRRNGDVVSRDGRNPVPDLDALPHPAWDLIPVKKYFGKRMGDLLFSRPEQMSVYTSRSCPYHCIFCHNLFGTGFRAQSAKRVFEEFSILYHEYGIREFHVQDDIFNLHAERAKEVCRKIISGGLKIVMAFPNGLRGDLMDDELIDLLYDAGARRIAYAVESASPRIQKMIRKRLNLDDLAEAVRKTAGKGILIKGFFMLGFPTETREEMEMTARYARTNDFDVANFSRVIPTKGTELYRIVKEMGKNADFTYEHYTYDYSNINLSDLEDREFERTIRAAYLRFMVRPRRLARLVRLFPNKKQIFPYYFLLLLVKLFVRKTPAGVSTKPDRPRWWRIRY